jgi:hypothetical protein
MKKTISYSLLLISMLTILACNNKAGEPTKDGGSACADDSVSTVLYPVDSARNAIQRFDSLSNALFTAVDSAEGHPANGVAQVPIKAFTIRAVDLLAAMGMPTGYADSSFCTYKHVRVYLGLTDRFKLFIVPVHNADISAGNGGEDYLVDSTGIAIVPGTDPGQSRYVLDLNAPCPNTCAINNELPH